MLPNQLILGALKCSGQGGMMCGMRCGGSQSKGCGVAKVECDVQGYVGVAKVKDVGWARWKDVWNAM